VEAVAAAAAGADTAAAEGTNVRIRIATCSKKNEGAWSDSNVFRHAHPVRLDSMALLTTAATAARMRAMLRINPARYWWSAKEWAEFLDCSSTKIVSTQTWKTEIRVYRQKSLAEGPQSDRT